MTDPDPRSTPAATDPVANTVADGSGSTSATASGDPDPTLPADDDPRLQSEYIETLAGADGETIVLVGVVHDHPASGYRVRRVVEHVAPDVLALELPSIAVPLFERYATDGETPPREGGEMSAAIQATLDLKDPVAVTGIDLPSRRFARELAGVLRRERPSLGTLRSVAGEIGSVVRHAVRCRVAATAGLVGAVEENLGRVNHEVSVTHSPAEQAAHEASHLARSRSLLGAIQRPAAMALTDEARERAMASYLDDLGRGGDVVAVVGFDHLEDVAGHLEDAIGSFDDAIGPFDDAIGQLDDVAGNIEDGHGRFDDPATGP